MARSKDHPRRQSPLFSSNRIITQRNIKPFSDVRARLYSVLASFVVALSPMETETRIQQYSTVLIRDVSTRSTKCWYPIIHTD